MAGAPTGNNNYKKGKLWAEAITRALDQRAEGKGKTRIEALADVADQLLQKAEQGDIAALRELADRIDGKASQDMVIQGGDEPVRIHLTSSQALQAKIRGLVAVPGVVQGLGESGEGAERGEGAGEV